MKIMTQHALFLIWLVFLSTSVFAQQCENSAINLFAGFGQGGYTQQGQASASRVHYPLDMTTDEDGNVYFADALNNVVRKVNSNGYISLIAGIPKESGTNYDAGQAVGCKLSYPTDVTIDAAGNIYIADALNGVIRQVTPDGLISVIAGQSDQGLGYGGDDIPATESKLNFPSGVAVDLQGNIYIADRFNHRIRKVEASSRIITTIAGTGERGAGENGLPATLCEIDSPSDIIVDEMGNIYFTDTGNHMVRRIDTQGNMSAYVGLYDAGFSNDGKPIGSSRLNNPVNLSIDSNGDLYIADQGNARICKITNGKIWNVVGTGSPAYPANGALAAQANINPHTVHVDNDGNIYYSEWNNNRILKISCPSDLPSIYREAECAGVGGNWLQRSHNAASGSSYVYFPGVGASFNSPNSPDDFIRFFINASETGIYELFLRLQATNQRDNSLWVRINNGSWVNFNNIATGFGFKWRKVHDSDNGAQIINFQLIGGINVIDIGVAEDGMKLDKIALIPQGEPAPIQKGEDDPNCNGSFSDNTENNTETPAFNFTANTTKASVLAYPNPFTSELRISNIDQVEQVSIINAVGQVVWTKANVYEGESIDINHLPEGWYTLRMNNEGAWENVRIQKIN